MMTMQEFLGIVVAEALGWPQVESVTTRLVLAYRFENDGQDGEVRLHLTDNRQFGYVFSSYELQYARNHVHLLATMKAKYEKALTGA